MEQNTQQLVADMEQIVGTDCQTSNSPPMSTQVLLENMEMTIQQQVDIDRPTEDLDGQDSIPPTDSSPIEQVAVSDVLMESDRSTNQEAIPVSRSPAKIADPDISTENKCSVQIDSTSSSNAYDQSTTLSQSEVVSDSIHTQDVKEVILQQSSNANQLQESTASTGTDVISVRSTEICQIDAEQKLSKSAGDVHSDQTSPDIIGPVFKKARLDESEVQHVCVTPDKKEDINPTPADDLSHEKDLSADLFSDQNLSEEQSVSSCTLHYDFIEKPSALTGTWDCFTTHSPENYLRGCKWSPDGSCILTNSNDNNLRLFNLPQQLYYDGGETEVIPQMSPVLKMKEADTIYDFCWYPKMSSNDPDTCCFVSTSRETPIHMWDAFTGELLCSYRAFNNVDQIAAAHSLSFSLDGSKLFCGFNKMIRVFDVTRPGRQYQQRPTFAKEGQSGIISCIAHSPTEDGLYAAGSYSRAIALYAEPTGDMVCMFQGQQGGVTHIAFSPDGTKLYSGGRKDPEILCWDLRNPGQILYSMMRKVETNQRIYFDQTSCGRYVVSGCHDGSVSVWDTEASPVQLYPDSDPYLHPVGTHQLHTDTVNGVSLHPTLPVLASCSGQRHFHSRWEDSDEGSSSEEEERSEDHSSIDYSLRLWWLAKLGTV